MVEQVLALASSNDTAKVQVQRRTTAAHLVAAASAKNNPQDHRCASAVLRWEASVIGSSLQKGS
eukprot:1148117-Pelagomonas_calceolata.AAC.2